MFEKVSTTFPRLISSTTGTAVGQCADQRAGQSSVHPLSTTGRRLKEFRVSLVDKVDFIQKNRQKLVFVNKSGVFLFGRTMSRAHRSECSLRLPVGERRHPFRSPSNSGKETMHHGQQTYYSSHWQLFYFCHKVMTPREARLFSDSTLRKKLARHGVILWSV